VPYTSLHVLGCDGWPVVGCRQDAVRLNDSPICSGKKAGRSVIIVILPSIQTAHRIKWVQVSRPETRVAVTHGACVVTS
jgi:hypothetical protein